MIKISKINFKILLAGIIPLFIFIYFAYQYTSKSIQVQENQIYTKITLDMTKRLELLIQEKKEAVLIIGTSISHNQNIRNFLINKHKNILSLDKFSLKLKKNSSLQNVWFQVIDMNGVSLYRSWTKKKGDSLLSARLDIAQIIKKPKIISSISTGKYDLTFKTMVPLYNKWGVAIGIIETIAKFNSISIKMESNNYKVLILVDKKYKKQLTKAFTKLFIQDYYIAQLKPDETLMKLLKSKKIENFLNIDTFRVYKKNSLLLTTYKQKDIYGDDMAYFILAKDLNTIDLSDINETINTNIVVTLFIILTIFFMLYYFYIINYQLFIKNQNKILVTKVKNKTKELNVKNEELQYQSEHDYLTSLPNRFLFVDRLTQSIIYSDRRKYNIGVLFLDLDGFKEVNDIHGHDIGDELLIMVTKRLLKCVRSEDTIARIGGDEFTIIIQNTKNSSIVKIVNKIINSMEEAFFIKNIELHTTFSIGISTFPNDGSSPEVLLKNADTAMYKAKNCGRNNYKFYNEDMTNLALKKVQLEKDLKNALINEEFDVYFQAKIDGVTLEVIGLEALIRWNHPTRGIVFPVDFIPFAEDIGFIYKIDKYMMKKSMQKVLQWQEDGVKTGKLSVNISTKYLEQLKNIDELKKLIDNIGFDTKYLEIEITETQIMKDTKSSILILNEIRDLGITISVDDFGTGYSSLSYLKKLPINKLKIDKSFIDDLPHDNDDVAIVKTIISLAKNLNLEIIAEGVEIKEQVDFLIENGCQNIQGYYYCKPLNEEDCKNFLIKNSL